ASRSPTHPRESHLRRQDPDRGRVTSPRAARADRRSVPRGSGRALLRGPRVRRVDGVAEARRCEPLRAVRGHRHLDAAHAVRAGRCAVLPDPGGVDGPDRRAFEVLAGFRATHMPELASRTRKLAVVRSAGLAGAAFTGLFHDFARGRFDAELFADRASALAWL